MKKDILYEAVIIGAGPKGLASSINLQKNHNLRVATLDVRGPGSSWRPDRMNPRVPLNPAFGTEILHTPSLNFQSFWENHYSKKKKEKHPLHHGNYTANHFRAYLEWLASYITWNNGKVEDIKPTGEHFEVAYHELGGSHSKLKTRSIITATGLIGFGGLEFAHDPTSIRHESPHIAHTPAELKTEKEVSDFLKDAEDIAIVGGGDGAASMFWKLKQIPWIKNIHLIISSTIEEEGFDHEKSLRRRLRTHDFEVISGEKRKVVHADERIIGAKEENGKIVLKTSKKNISVHKVILATGYKYDFGKISFMNTIHSRRGWKAATGTEGRYPLLNQNHQLIEHGEPTQIYLLGEGAKSLGKDQRLLGSTAPTVEIITSSLLNHLGQFGKS